MSTTLTPREHQVAELLAWGGAKKEIAHRLHITVRTAENFCRSIYAKLGVSKATEVSVWYFTSRFNISLDLSPLKRSVTSLALLLLMGVQLLACDGEMVRSSARVRTARVRTGNVRTRTRRTENEF